MVPINIEIAVVSPRGVPNLIGKNTIADMDDCLKYLEKKLKKHDFDEIKIYKPNMIYVKWSVE